MALGLTALLLSGCTDYVILQVTPPPATPVPLPPIGFNHRYGNSPVTSADGFDYERTLFASQVFWEVGLRGDPQLAGYVDRSDPNAVTRARTNTTALVVTMATERLDVIRQMLALPTDADQQQYCVAVLQHFRSIGYTNLTKASVIIFFTEQDEHSLLDWTPATGYTFKVYDNDLRGNAIRPGPTQSPLPPPAP